ncbi:hypothetical protein ABT391_31470 [Streptomyces jumonjinensis]|uniref:hypothetical protein n=1 Tax=Streptomyces jumonjinensis TaxID=1945 RepID=UPI0033207757
MTTDDCWMSANGGTSAVRELYEYERAVRELYEYERAVRELYECERRYTSGTRAVRAPRRAEPGEWF